MEIIGSLLFLLAVVLIVVVIIARPFLLKETAHAQAVPDQPQKAEDERDHQHSALLAEQDRILTALQDLDFDFVLGKVPEDDYPEQRAALVRAGADVFRKLDQMQPEALATTGAEDRIEAAVAARRADARLNAAGVSPVAADAVGNGNGSGVKDSLEDVIAARKRQRKETTGGFCPKCGRPVSKSDKFCSKCGTTL